jgi:hypothetical protein
MGTSQLQGQNRLLAKLFEHKFENLSTFAEAPFCLSKSLPFPNYALIEWSGRYLSLGVRL